MWRVHFILAGMTASLLVTMPAWAAGVDPYAYKLEIAPMEGPTNPEVDARYTPQFQSCQKRAVTTLQNVDCVVAEFDRQDAALNRAWKAAVKRIPKTKYPELLAAQRKWVKERDPFCKSEAAAWAGTISQVTYPFCRTELTIRRTIWLEKLN